MGLLTGAVGVLVEVSPCRAQVTERASVASGGAVGNGASELGSISADGRYVAFASFASNLVLTDANGHEDIFVHDRWSGRTEIVTVSTSGQQANDATYAHSISGDGRFVVFASRATNLVAGDTNGHLDVFVRDREAGTTERVSLSSGGEQGNDESGAGFGSISADGRYVTFVSFASNLVPRDTNGTEDVFVRDRWLGTTERVSVSSDGAEGDASSGYAVISADGLFVAFESKASNLIPNDTNGNWDVFVHDRSSRRTERLSVSSSGAQADGECGSPSISGDGTRVAFESFATNLVTGDTNGLPDIFVRDRRAATTERASVGDDGHEGNGMSDRPSISADGRYVAFESTAWNLVPGDRNGWSDVFVRDRLLGTTELVSLSTEGVHGDSGSGIASISNDGRHIAFESAARNLVARGSIGPLIDVYVRDRAGAGFTSLCGPGRGGVIRCPCSNAPSSPGRGCDNSSSTGGASLSAAGIAYLSMDTLVFTTEGERPGALSILAEGRTVSASGAAFGQGVVCVSGPILELYTKPALDGAITVPDFAAGDPSISSRSAAVGDSIRGGQSRWYVVLYRDPTVSGTCSSSSTFNATPTGRVVWWP